MNWLQQIDAGKLLLFTVILVRVSGLTMIAPIYGTRDVPVQSRILLSVMLALLITPVHWQAGLDLPTGLLPYLVLLGSELLVGISLGLGMMILLSSLQLAGEMIGRTSGLMLSDIFDPHTEASVPLVGQLMYFVALAAFVAIGGHRLVMAALLDTFQALPPGRAAVPDSLVQTFALLVTESLGLGIRASIPVVTSLLMATVVLGLVSRTLPQLNVLMLGFGLNALLMFGVLALTLGAAVWVFQEQIEPTVTAVLEMLHSTAASAQGVP